MNVYTFLIISFLLHAQIFKIMGQVLISELFRKIWKTNSTWEMSTCSKDRDHEVPFHFARFQILLLFYCCKLAKREPSSRYGSGYIAVLCNNHSSCPKTSFPCFCHMHIQVLSPVRWVTDWLSCSLLWPTGISLVFWYPKM